ncbi:MAG: cation-translocating P-type ATPase [Dehalococcoidaceae bacterium]|nr:cation-translocating P-type ATPase [Dehalococcoidaceae bacterium]
MTEKPVPAPPSCKSCGLENEAASLSLFIEEMDCANEKAIVTNKLANLEGILDFAINLASQKVDISYSPGVISPQAIIRSIAATGMNPRLAQVMAKDNQWWRDWRIKLIAVSGVLLLGAFLAERLGLARDIARYVYAAAIIVGGYFPAKMAVSGIRTRTLNIYALLIVATVGAVALGFWDEAALLVFVYTWGAVLETFATRKARSSLKSLVEMLPAEALVIKNGQEITTNVEQIEPGEIIKIKPGQKIPLDGNVFAGSSSVDQAPVTGESMPVAVTAGDSVFAGSINQQGYLEVETTRRFDDTTLSRIIHSVERAESKKSSYQRFAENFGNIYTPVVFVVSLLVAVVPWLLGQPFDEWFYRALVLLVVSCSCGLVLSVPITVLSAVSAAAKHGLLIKGGADLEAAGNIQVLAFDKTGTLTTGHPQVTDIFSLKASDMEVLSIAATIESRSGHPLAGAVLEKARREGVKLASIDDFSDLPGLGARGTIAGKTYYAGNTALYHKLSIDAGKPADLLTRLENEGKTAILVMDDSAVLGIIAAADRLRPEARATVKRLTRSGMKHIVMLTGDNEGTARSIAAEAGIEEYRSAMLPEDKTDAVKELKARYGRIGLVGDGVNDAPAMTAADVGIAMGAAGSDIALETADMALMADDLARLPYLFETSRKAVAVIRQNVAASLIIVGLVVTLALTGVIGLVPGLLINEGGALLVMLNGLRLLK